MTENGTQNSEPTSDSDDIISPVQAMADLIATALVDAEKFAQGNNTAGTRLRGQMQQLKAMAQQVRQQVTEIKAQR